jgi:hypothetical protein
MQGCAILPGDSEHPPPPDAPCNQPQDTGFWVEVDPDPQPGWPYVRGLIRYEDPGEPFSQKPLPFVPEEDMHVA